MKRLVLLIVTACVMPILASGNPFIREGERFPEIVLPAIDDGAALSIASFRGQKLMLHNFASW